MVNEYNTMVEDYHTLLKVFDTMMTEGGVHDMIKENHITKMIINLNNRSTKLVYNLPLILEAKD